MSGVQKCGKPLAHGPHDVVDQVSRDRRSVVKRPAANVQSGPHKRLLYVLRPIAERQRVPVPQHVEIKTHSGQVVEQRRVRVVNVAVHNVVKRLGGGLEIAGDDLTACNVLQLLKFVHSVICNSVKILAFKYIFYRVFKFCNVIILSYMSIGTASSK